MITIQILTRNNAKTIERTINSIKPLEGQILIGDLGSTDDTVAICQRLGCEVYSLKSEPHRAKARNKLMARQQYEWSLYLQPFEGLVGGIDEIKEAIDSQERCYRLQVMATDDVLSKEVRLWKKNTLRFSRPVFEGLENPVVPPLCSAVICSDSQYSYLELKAKCDQWKIAEPTSCEPIYYLACLYLSFGKHDDFLNTANHYLFRIQKSSDATMMMRYYMAIVLLRIKADQTGAAKKILMCLEEKPLMAEFWCVLGDIFLSRNEISKSITFYENALILGRHRDLFNDDLPIELSKYSNYPTQMIESLHNISKAE